MPKFILNSEIWISISQFQALSSQFLYIFIILHKHTNSPTFKPSKSSHILSFRKFTFRVVFMSLAQVVFWTKSFQIKSYSTLHILLILVLLTIFKIIENWVRNLNLKCSLLFLFYALFSLFSLYNFFARVRLGSSWKDESNDTCLGS